MSLAPGGGALVPSSGHGDLYPVRLRQHPHLPRSVPHRHCLLIYPHRHRRRRRAPRRASSVDTTPRATRFSDTNGAATSMSSQPLSTTTGERSTCPMAHRRSRPRCSPRYCSRARTACTPFRAQHVSRRCRHFTCRAAAAAPPRRHATDRALLAFTLTRVLPPSARRLLANITDGLSSRPFPLLSQHGIHGPLPTAPRQLPRRRPGCRWPLRRAGHNCTPSDGTRLAGGGTASGRTASGRLRASCRGGTTGGWWQRRTAAWHAGGDRAPHFTGAAGGRLCLRRRPLAIQRQQRDATAAWHAGGDRAPHFTGAANEPTDESTGHELATHQPPLFPPLFPPCRLDAAYSACAVHACTRSIGAA